MDDGVTDPGIETARALRHLRLIEVAISTSNPRHSIAGEPFHELKQSIEKNGLLQPVIVRRKGDKFELIGGHRRYAAVIELAAEQPRDERFATIAAVVIDADDAAASVLQLAENLNRSDLTPLEIADGLANALSKDGMTKEKLAASIGWQGRKLGRYLQVHAAPAWLKDLARSVPVPKERVDDSGATIIDPIRDEPVVDIEELPGLAFTDVLELVVLHNVLHERDQQALKKHDTGEFKRQAERVTRKLAQQAAREGWNTERLREEAKKLKDGAAPARNAKQTKASKHALEINDKGARIDFARAKKLDTAAREAFATKLATALRSLGYSVVITPPTPEQPPRSPVTDQGRTSHFMVKPRVQQK